jgi:hypothetical protein
VCDLKFFFFFKKKRPKKIVAVTVARKPNGRLGWPRCIVERVPASPEDAHIHIPLMLCYIEQEVKRLVMKNYLRLYLILRYYPTECSCWRSQKRTPLVGCRLP